MRVKLQDRHQFYTSGCWQHLNVKRSRKQRGGIGTGPRCVAHAQLLKLQKGGSFPDEPAHKKHAHKLTVKAAKGGSNSRHNRNRIRVTVIIIRTVIPYFFSCVITAYLLSARVENGGFMKHRVRATPPALVRYTEVHDDVDSGIREVSLQSDVFTPLTLDGVLVRCRYLGDCARGGMSIFCLRFFTFSFPSKVTKHILLHSGRGGGYPLLCLKKLLLSSTLVVCPNPRPPCSGLSSLPPPWPRPAPSPRWRASNALASRLALVCAAESPDSA